MILARALRLAVENRRLRDHNVRLVMALRQAHDRCQQLERDATLLVLMARDRSVAVEFVAAAHRIDRLDEVTG